MRTSVYTEFLASLCVAATSDAILRLPAADGRIGLVAREDVARCLAVCALHDPVGGALAVTGPQLLQLSDIAALTGSVYRPVSEATFMRHPAGGETPWWSYAYTSMFASIREQRWDHITDTVARLTGAAPQTAADVLSAA